MSKNADKRRFPWILLLLLMGIKQIQTCYIKNAAMIKAELSKSHSLRNSKFCENSRGITNIIVSSSRKITKTAKVFFYGCSRKKIILKTIIKNFNCPTALISIKKVK